MGRSDLQPLRSLPRVFIPGVSAVGPIELPRAELEKFRKVLRLQSGAQIAVLPNDGTLIRCSLEGNSAVPIAIEHPNTEPKKKVVIAQALPKGDRLEIVIRMGTELGVAGFILFPADRSVVRWDSAKVEERLRRYNTIARESAEQSFRSVLPSISYVANLDSLLQQDPGVIVLSESEKETKALSGSASGASNTIVVGPEGGWSPREMALIGDRGVSLGPLVLRSDTAGPAAAALLLLN